MNFKVGKWYELISPLGRNLGRYKCLALDRFSMVDNPADIPPGVRGFPVLLANSGRVYSAATGGQCSGGGKFTAAKVTKYANIHKSVSAYLGDRSRARHTGFAYIYDTAEAAREVFDSMSLHMRSEVLSVAVPIEVEDN